MNDESVMAVASDALEAEAGGAPAAPLGATVGAPEGCSPLEALIACRVRESQKWGPRWLERAGFRVSLAADPAEVESLLETSPPSLIVMEAALNDGRRPLYEALIERFGRRLPLVVMCSRGREARMAVEAGVADVMRRPYDWRLISRRAVWITESLRSSRELQRVRQALDRAMGHVRAVERQLERKGAIDPLTELPTRSVFREQLERMEP